MSLETPSSRPAFNRKNPLVAKIARRKLLTEGCKEKETWHFELDLQGSGMDFLPGDSLALFAHNDPALADEILAALGFSGDETVTDPNKQEVPVRQALIESCSITAPEKKFLTTLTEKAGESASDIATLLQPDHKDALSNYLWGLEIIDLLKKFPSLEWTPQEFVSVLKKLNVRLYSIASSLKAKPNECHLTVALVQYESHGRTRRGVCSSWIAQRTDESTPAPCFITPGKGFRLPEPEEDIPVIMIGPGTGIAPFRAFLQERDATNAKGKTWLFFGEIHEQTCFLYSDEWDDYLAKGVLNKVTTAWSRDQAEKVYVQHKIVEHGAELWSWLEQGAIVYVCGDAERMAPDVDKALHDIIAAHGGKSEEESAAYVEQMRKDKRYRRDVY
ncbi:MAG: sulfite reductase subunit alpha [Verrucomicrobiales bacterium]|nr:sulfite reductase subunit alpha [Verrucomicrobiales bacterium]